MTEILTHQIIFDRVVDHLRAQGEPAINNDEECMYRAPDGKKCAFGCLITDEEYNPQWELTVATILIKDEKCLSRFIPYRQLINVLQTIHDDIQPEEWESRFEACAEKFNLVYTAPSP